MSTVGRKLNLRCFVDGIEIPVIGSRCTFSEGQPATAQVQVIGTDQAEEIPPRSLVELFVYDNHDFAPNEDGRLVREILAPVDPRRWKMMYQGEVMGFTFSHSEAERHATLMCADFTNYWDYIRQHYVNFQNGGVELFENAFLGVDARHVKNFDVIGKDAHSNILTWLSEAEFREEVTDAEGNTTTEKFANLYLGVQRILREMFFASNRFYAQAFNRLRLGDQIVGLPSDRTAASLFKMDFFGKFINNRIGGAGGMVTMRDLVSSLLGLAFHTHVTVPFPRFDVEGVSAGFRPDAGAAGDAALAGLIIERGTYTNATLNSTIIKPDTTFLVPPACNIVFPHQYTSLTYQRNTVEEPTRLFLRTSLMFTGQNKWLTERFYAPDFEVFTNLLGRVGGFNKRQASVLLPHEAFTGINPMMAWQNDMAAYVQKGRRREYLSKMADYLFWKYRFAGRAVNVSMPLNMELVCGYPALIMDRVATSLSVTRHWLGNVQTLVHQVDQNGGWTHMTMTGARRHDEVQDYDGRGRTLEEITSRGTDGFLDDRYDLENIGKEVYQTLFGVGSLVDLQPANLTGGGIFLDVDATTGNALADLLTPAEGTTFGEYLDSLPIIARKVAELQFVYRTALTAGVNIDAFTASITQRPKANMAQILGVEFSTLATLAGTEEFQAVIEQVLNANLEPEGFMSVAVDPQAEDLNNDTFTATTTETTYTFQSVTVGDRIEGGVSIPGAPTVVQVPTTVRSGEQGSYNLRELVETRRAFVQAYVDSLQDRGIRG